MRRMFSEKQIEEMIEKGTSIEELKPILEGSFVKIMDAPESTTLTDEEIAQIIEGTFIEGSFLGRNNPVLCPADDLTSIYRGMFIASNTIGVYEINKSSKVISLNSATVQTIALRSVSSLNGKNIPTYPASTGTFVLKCVDGALTWVAEE